MKRGQTKQLKNRQTLEQTLAKMRYASGQHTCEKELRVLPLNTHKND